MADNLEPETAASPEANGAAPETTPETETPKTRRPRSTRPKAAATAAPAARKPRAAKTAAPAAAPKPAGRRGRSKTETPSEQATTILVTEVIEDVEESVDSALAFAEHFAAVIEDVANRIQSKRTDKKLARQLGKAVESVQIAIELASAAPEFLDAGGRGLLRLMTLLEVPTPRKIKTQRAFADILRSERKALGLPVPKKSKKGKADDEFVIVDLEPETMFAA